MMNKVVVITGGATGIGRRMVEDFASAGYRVAFSYFSSKQVAKELQKDLRGKGYEVICSQMDLANDEDIRQFVDYVISEYNKIDILINNGATTHDCLYIEKTSESFEKILRTNLIGAFQISKIVGEIMKNNEWGRIINISSTNGIDTYFPMCLEYDASKAGLNSLTHNLAIQLSPYVNVNAIAPGFIGTENELKDMDEEFMNLEKEKILVRRIGKEEDVSNLAMFLASDKASFINNQIIKVNGGAYGD